MRLLGQTTVPTRIYEASQTDPVFLARMLGIARITGLYTSDYVPALTPEQQQAVNDYLAAWRAANGY